MYCSNCGFHILPNADFKFCPQCGAHLLIPDELGTPAPAAPPVPTPSVSTTPATPTVAPSPAFPPQTPPAPSVQAEPAASPAVPTPAPVAPPPSIDSVNANKQRVLIVEDDMFIRELYQKQLELAGFYVETAVDGLEGREKVKANPWSIVLLDIMLPKMNGLDLLKNMKQDPAVKDIPVVILSNLGQDSVVEKGLSLGAISYLVKADTTPTEMLELIHQKIG